MRDIQLKVRLSKEEMAALKKVQKKSNFETISAFIRFVIRKALEGLS